MKGKLFMEYITLTERERMVIQYLLSGMKNEDIAEILNISTHTIKAHLESVYSKLNVNNRVQCVIKALKLGLVDLDDIRDRE